VPNQGNSKEIEIKSNEGGEWEVKWRERMTELLEGEEWLRPPT